MPIYEYKCRKCTEVFEELVRGGGDEEGIACPQCGANTVEKLMSMFGMSGSGGFSSSAAGASCSGCSSHNCSSCH